MRAIKGNTDNEAQVSHMTDQAQVKLIWKAQDTKSSKTDLKVKEETVKKTDRDSFHGRFWV